MPELERRGVLRAGALAALAPIALASPAEATANAAPDVIVFCDQTLQSGLRAAGDRFTAQTGAPVRLFSTSPKGMVAQIAHVTQTDVLITQRPVMDSAAALIKADTLVALGRNTLVFAGRPVNVPRSDLRALLAEDRLAVTDPIADAPFDGRAVLARFNLLDLVHDRIDGMPDTRQAAFLVTSGRAKLALIYATDVRAAQDLIVLASTPEPITTEYAAAVVRISRSPNAAAFIAFLGTPEAKSALRNAGLEVT